MSREYKILAIATVACAIIVWVGIAVINHRIGL